MNIRRIVRTRWAALACSAALASGFATRAAAAAFVTGADVSWLTQFESMGVTWRDLDGTRQDALAILAGQSINAVRLRVFVNPPASGMANGYPLGFCDQASVLAMAGRAKAAGLGRLMIDFHYSDTWADPSHQAKPAAWAADSFDQLVARVYQHTFDVVSALAAKGIHPQWVQVGNEINGGLLWPDGAAAKPAQLAQLVNSGYDAVKAASPGSKVIVHLANGYDNAAFRAWFDAFFQNGGKCDVIGASYYPFWAGADYTESIAALRANLADMAARYGKEVMICEVGGLESQPGNTHDLLAAAISAVKAVPGGKGLGVFYWEPEAHSSITGGYALGATSRRAPNDLQFTSAITAFAVPKPPQSPVPPSTGATQLINLSARGIVENGDNVLIGGFVIAGTGTKRLLIRAVARSLLPYGVSGVLRQPLLTVYDSARRPISSAGVLDTYEDAQGAPLAAAAYLAPPNGVRVRTALAAAAQAVSAFDLLLPAWAATPQLDHAAWYPQGDAARILELPPGLYTAVVSPDPAAAVPDPDPAPDPYNSSSRSGIALLEIYDLNPDGGCRFLNLSSRGKIESGARQMIVGFYLGGNGARRVLLRGIGPALAAHGVNGALVDSSIEVFDAARRSLAQNDDWGAAAWTGEAAAAVDATGAFGFSSASLDAAVLIQLPASAGFSAIVSSVTGEPGVGMAEVYECPP